MVKNNKGFTFVDVVCAMAILALVALPICSGFLTAAKTNQRIKEKTEIVTLLNNELTKITSTGVVENVTQLDGVTGDKVGEQQAYIALSDTEKLPAELSFTKTLSDKTVTIGLTPTAALGSSGERAYVEITVTYINVKEDGSSDEYSVTGVWAA